MRTKLKCPACGATNSEGSVLCAYCGSQLSVEKPAGVAGVICDVASSVTDAVKPQAKRITAGLLGLFFGALGIHNFYLKRKRGVVQLIIFILGMIVVFIGIGLTVSQAASFVEESADVVGNIIAYTALIVIGVLLTCVSALWGFVESIMIFTGIIKV